MSQDLVDLEELVKLWVHDSPMARNHLQNAAEIQSCDINWDHVRIRHGPTEYFGTGQQSQPKTNVLLTSHFTNDTDQEQVFKLRSERRTTSVCSIAMEKAYMVGYSVDIKLAPPNPVVEANAGFKGEVTVTDADVETLEEELVWSVDSEVVVPPQITTTAELVMTENEYSTSFRCETSFKGDVAVTLRNKRNYSVITKLFINVRFIFRDQPRFRIDATGAYFVSEGTCKCRFGIEQHVKLTETPINGGNEINGRLLY